MKQVKTDTGSFVTKCIPRLKYMEVFEVHVNIFNLPGIVRNTKLLMQNQIYSFHVCAIVSDENNVRSSSQVL
jgi:hypothetical protein